MEGTQQPERCSCHTSAPPGLCALHLARLQQLQLRLSGPVQHADGEVLGARTAAEAVCARHGLHRSDLQEHADLLGFDISRVDDDSVHVKQVQASSLLIFPSQLSMHGIGCSRCP